MTSKKNLKAIFTEGEDKDAFEHSLINLVEPLKHLWDTKEADYKNRNKRQNAFVKIASSLGKSVNLLADACMKVWESLRTQFLACKRKVPTGSGADAVPSFRHYASMTFLSGLSGGHSPSSTFSNVELNDESQAHSPFPNTGDAEVLDLPEGSEVIANIVIDGPSATATASGSHSKFKGKRKPDPVDQEMLKYLKSVNEVAPEDSIDTFTKAMASKLRRVSEVDRKAAAICEMEIYKILHEAELKFL